MLFVKIFFTIVMIIVFIVGYLVGIKFKYKLVIGYDSKKRYLEYIEKKMCRHYGICLMVSSLIITILLLTNNTKHIYYFLMIGASYIIFIPNYVVIKELKKLK